MNWRGRKGKYEFLDGDREDTKPRALRGVSGDSKALETAPSVIHVPEMRRGVGDNFGHGTKCKVPRGECY